MTLFAHRNCDRLLRKFCSVVPVVDGAMDDCCSTLAAFEISFSVTYLFEAISYAIMKGSQREDRR